MRKIPALLVLALAGSGLTASASISSEPSADAQGDVTVIAVIDDGFSPYHYDWISSQMPQHLDEDPTNDLPLNTPPEEWIPGYDPYFPTTELPVTLPSSPGDQPSVLGSRDQSLWAGVQRGRSYWIPGSKIVTAIAFDNGTIYEGTGSHGVGSSSVSAGNVYGTCPECVVVLLQFSSSGGQQRAIRWATQQTWIDAITNSYGFSTVFRDNVTFHSDPAVTREAVERGQAIFWSAGNGQANAFVVPVNNHHSSDKGPDWIIQVGAISPSGTSYSGAGKTVDLAGIGSSYPSSIGATNSLNGRSFSGTSNATPTVAGIYARGLHLARRALPGASKIQQDGIVALGEPVACGDVRPDCEIGDGVLSATEIRDALFHSSVRTDQGMNVGGVGNIPVSSEVEMANEGYGSWFARQSGDTQAWLGEFERFWGALKGTTAYPARASGEREWMIVDSYCRQQLWGDWQLGAFVRDVTELPGSDQAWPIRSSLEDVCEAHPKVPLNRNLP